MKKIIFVVLATCSLAIGAKAQIQKGNIMIGSTLSNLSLGIDKPNAFSFNLSPKAAWFIRDGLALGGEVDFGLYTKTDAGTDINYGLSALARYYGETGANQVVRSSRFFGEATVGIQGVNPSSGENTNGLGFSFGPGFTYFVTPSIGLEALLKYNGVLGFGSSAYAHNLGLFIGFQIYLPGRSTAKKVQRDIETEDED